MSILASVTTGKQVGPQIHTIFGANGVGKTTWAASFPNVLLADLEKGSGHLNVARVPADKLKSLSDFRSLLKELRDTNHTFKTLAIDSVEALESLISDAVCAEGKVNSIEEYGGGYGKGFTRCREVMREILVELQGLQSKGITSILVAHSQTKSVTDPANNQTYDRVIMRCNDKMAAIVRDLSDNVFYATYKTFTTKENGKTKAFGDGQRVMYTQWRPGFDSKNRLDLPFELPLSYDAFVDACTHDAKVDIPNLIVELKEMAKNAPENLQATIAQQIEKFKDNATKLREIRNRLMKYQAA